MEDAQDVVALDLQNLWPIYQTLQSPVYIDALHVPISPCGHGRA